MQIPRVCLAQLITVWFLLLWAFGLLEHIGVNQRFLRVFPLLYSYVCIAMEALDQLLMACHCQSINLFVESFLKMVRKLLESDKPSLQILGTNSVSSQHCITSLMSLFEVLYFVSYERATQRKSCTKNNRLKISKHYTRIVGNFFIKKLVIKCLQTIILHIFFNCNAKIWP